MLKNVSVEIVGQLPVSKLLAFNWEGLSKIDGIVFAQWKEVITP